MKPSDSGQVPRDRSDILLELVKSSSYVAKRMHFSENETLSENQKLFSVTLVS